MAAPSTAGLCVPMSASIRKPSLTFRIGGEEVAVPLAYGISSNSAVFNREMVLEGLGIGVLPSALIDRKVAAGRFVTLLDAYELVGASTDIRLAYKHARAAAGQGARVRRTRGALLRRAALRAGTSAFRRSAARMARSFLSPASFSHAAGAH